ncbi:MAG: hypothetical protein Q9174_004066 [Haloplaca sp. 1 TL-2023]
MTPACKHHQKVCQCTARTHLRTVLTYHQFGSTDCLVEVTNSGDLDSEPVRGSQGIRKRQRSEAGGDYEQIVRGGKRHRPETSASHLTTVDQYEGQQREVRLEPSNERRPRGFERTVRADGKKGPESYHPSYILTK